MYSLFKSEPTAALNTDANFVLTPSSPSSSNTSSSMGSRSSTMFVNDSTDCASTLDPSTGAAGVCDKDSRMDRAVILFDASAPSSAASSSSSSNGPSARTDMDWSFDPGGRPKCAPMFAGQDVAYCVLS